MDQDLQDTVNALMGSADNAQPSSLDREALEAALQRAYNQGRQDTTDEQSNDPPLEVIFFRELMQCLPDYVYFKDLKSQFVTTNPAHAGHLGRTVDEVIGKSDYDFFQRDDAEIKMADEREILRTGEGFPEPRIEHHFKADGVENWTLSTKHPWHDSHGRLGGTFGLSRDITEKMKAEQALATQHRLMQTLINVLPCRIFVRDREHRFRLINEEYRRFLGNKTDVEVIGKRLDEILDYHRVGIIANEDETIMKTGVPVLRRVERDISPVTQDRWVSISKVPLRGDDGKIEGIVGVAFDVSAQKEAEARVRATGKELSVKNDQIESELALARRLQIAFATFRFPSRLTLANKNRVRAAYLYEPSEHLAGDFFQLLQVDEHCFAAFICDVMGHGVRSALVTAVIRGLIEENRAELCYPDRLFSHISGILNRLAQDPDFPRFVTATLALFDTREGLIRLVNAGHPPILCYCDDPQLGGLRKLPVHRNPALGLLPNFSYRIAETPLKTGCSYLLYTDGILEEPNSEGKEFGRKGIALALEGIDAGDPGSIIHNLRKTLSIHAGRATFSDDVCAMALSIQGS